jgi:hypothetical protein
MGSHFFQAIAWAATGEEAGLGNATSASAAVRRAEWYSRAISASSPAERVQFPSVVPFIMAI